MNRRWWALVAVSLATFMTYLDNNVVNVALPTIQRDLGLSISGLEWIVSCYMLVFAGLLMAGGRLADVFGQRRVFLTGLGVFTIASAAAGLSGDGATLIVSRGLQGVGAALLTPTALALIPQVFPDPRERGTAVGVWSAIGGLALALGPVTGGFISENWHWGWIYLINVPIGVVTFALAAWAIRRSAPGVRHRLDVPGLLVSSLGLFALTFALIEGESRGWTSGLILGSFAVAALAAAVFVVIESRAAEPMIDLSLFRERVFSGGLLSMGLWAFGIFGIYFFTALWLQNVLGFTPTQAGAAFVPMALLMAALATVAPRLAARLGTGPTVAAGLGLMAAAVVALSFVGEHGTYGQIFPWLMLYGLGAGLLVPLTNAILGALPAGRGGVASGVLNVSREVFGLLGVTILGAILSARQSAAIADGAGPLPAFLQGYQLALVVAGVIVAVGVPVSLVTLRARRTAPPSQVDVPKVPEPVG
ncbi:MFS transporter [Sphaerisporangium siamense]|uniref:EmrB/QacA subfamily drug resistance transporter n=1 Tax=Sphaerisporangium siamense TaxID=795645 RepID=A0A7W7D7H9_9ACTN|nr:MFS transporter [Sphaerisporangium siamense]MBB4700386.1 EmrB/QacA subfamily drug resistance transporter [Sphaerisporangium siamense]